MKYYLMNKNAEVGTFELRHGTFGDEFRFEYTGQSPLPIGFDYIEKWIENRKASKHNTHLKQIMADCGCDKTEGFIKITHAASINDTFWIKSEHENVSWEQISFYRNPFDETISKKFPFPDKKLRKSDRPLLMRDLTVPSSIDALSAISV